MMKMKISGPLILYLINLQELIMGITSITTSRIYRMKQPSLMNRSSEI